MTTNTEREMLEELLARAADAFNATADAEIAEDSERQRADLGVLTDRAWLAFESVQARLDASDDELSR